MDARLICIIGGGISGLAFAALHRQQGGEAIVLEKNIATAAEDGKSVVINATSMKMLSRLGAFAELTDVTESTAAESTTAAESITQESTAKESTTKESTTENLTNLTNAADSSFALSAEAKPKTADNLANGLTNLATTTLSEVRVCFQGAPGGLNIKGDELGYGIFHHNVRNRLAAVLGDALRAPAAVEDISPQQDGVQIRYKTADDKTHNINAAAAIIACELPTLPPPFTARQYDYRQAIISFATAATHFPKHYAMESFSRHGIIALVPRAEVCKPVGVILCADTAAAGALSALPDDALLKKINDVFGGRFGLHTPSSRFVYAPQARHVSPLADGRIAFLGAGATILHPAGAQGLNMGLSDADYLATCFAAHEDIIFALKKYARRRTPIHYGMLAATSMLAAGGHLRQLPFRLIGGVGAAAMSVLPWRRLVS